MKLSPEFQSQYDSLTSGVGFYVFSDRTILSVTGSDRAAFLQSFTTNDVRKLVPGLGCEAFVTSPQGKTLGHVLIFCEPDRFVLDSSPNQAEALVSHFQRYIITEDVEFVDQTSQVKDILVAGPKATQLLKSVAELDVPAEMLSHCPAMISGCHVALRRVECAGPLAYFVQTATGDVEVVANALFTNGAVLCDAAAVESARLEAGFPLFDVDITADHLPQEVARDAKAISFTKGCYLGQETVARIDAVGHVNRVLVGLKFLGTDIPPGGTELQAEGQTVGHVTSAAWSPRLDAPLALAYLRRNFAKPGTALGSSLGNFEVVKMPLVAA